MLSGKSFGASLVRTDEVRGKRASYATVNLLHTALCDKQMHALLTAVNISQAVRILLRIARLAVF